MLLELSIGNYRSVRQRQTLSLVASASKELRDTHVLDLGKTLSAVRSAVIYGPNAAGKSNFLMGIATMQQLVQLSANFPFEQELPFAPFIFDDDARLEPTVFEVVFLEGGVRYQYGFEFNTERIVYEWLKAFPKGHAQTWFEREYNPSVEGDYDWQIGSYLEENRNRLDLLKRSTKKNGLFLSTAVQLNNAALRSVYFWFINKVVVVNNLATLNFYSTVEMLKDPHRSGKVQAFLKAADLSIDHLVVKEEDAPQGMFNFSVMPFSLAGSSAPGQVKSIRVQAVHRKLDGSGNVAFEMKDESEGTRRLIQYAGGWLKVLQDGAVLFFDELDVSLHPAITRFLISLFNNPEQNLDGAQLVFSTHDTNLLDKDLFRRDQIWFTEKDKKEETRLYPLLDFSPRQDDNLEKGYLRGRYGALPFVGSILFDGQ